MLSSGRYCAVTRSDWVLFTRGPHGGNRCQHRHGRRSTKLTPKDLSESDLLAIAKDHILMTRMDKSFPTGPVLERAEGSVVWDVNGKEYLDFNSGQMCSALGHRHLRITDAIRRACDTMIHASSSYFNVQDVTLAKKLASILDRPLKRSLFLESGSDANEAAMSIARRYQDLYEIASPSVSFHGFSDGARAVTYSGWRRGYGPYSPGTYAFTAPYCYRCPIGLKYPSCRIACLDGAFEVLDAQVDKGLAAIITEPLFSAGGVIEPPKGWLTRLKEKCKQRGALLILDEAQTGLAKLGTMWAYQQEEDAKPDLLTMSKHFGGGLSISAVATSDEIADKVQSTGFVHAHSHSSDPIACAAANASIDIIVDDDLVDRARDIGTYWHGHLMELASSHEVIGDVRGRGLLHGLELVQDRESKEPASEIGRELERECVDTGLFFSVRRGGSVIRFVPPWSTTRSQFDAAADILDRALTKVVSKFRVRSGDTT